MGAGISNTEVTFGVLGDGSGNVGMSKVKGTATLFQSWPRLAFRVLNSGDFISRTYTESVVARDIITCKNFHALIC